MATADRKAVIKHADMNEEMQQDAIDCANQALEKFNIEKDIAAYIKKEFDKKYNPTWHCVVGRNFGSYVTHETKHFIYFYMGQVAILLFKSGWSLSLIPLYPSKQIPLVHSPTLSALPPRNHLFLNFHALIFQVAFMHRCELTRAAHWQSIQLYNVHDKTINVIVGLQ